MIGGWLASQGAGLILGAIAKLLTDMWSDYQHRQFIDRAARAEVAAEINKAAAETTDAMAQVAANPATPDDVTARLRRKDF